MAKNSALDKTEAREHFENQLRFAFVQYDCVEEDEDVTEVRRF